MRILVVEDIEQQGEWLCKKLRQLYQTAEVQHVRTESEFHQLAENFRSDPPALAIIDMMLRWSDPAPDMPEAPAEVNDDGRRAGLRCVRLLQGDPRSAGVPIIIRTVLEDIDFEDGELPSEIPLVTRESDSDHLFRLIDEAIRAKGNKS